MTNTSANSLSSQTLQAAIAYYKSSQLVVAERMCRQALLDDPEDAYFLHLLGVIVGDSGHYDAAIELFGQAVQRKKNNPQFFFSLGLALQKTGKLDEALLKYKKAVSLKPDYTEAHVNMGDVLRKQGRFDEAELKYKRVIAFKREYAALYCALGESLHKQGKTDEAVLAYQKAVTFKPLMPEALHNLGVIFYGQKKFDAAAEMYRQALSARPGYAEAYYDLGNLLKEQGKLDEAIAHYTKAVALKPDFADARINLGLVLHDRGRLDEALAHYEQVLLLQPDNAAILGEVIHLLYYTCGWENLRGRDIALLGRLRQKPERISPFSLLGMPSTMEDQLAGAKAFVSNWEKPQQDLFKHTPRKSGGLIKIGYLSADFYSHATAYLMAGLFERHDRACFNVAAYSYGPDDKGAMRERLVKAFDSFVDLKDLSDQEAAQRIYDDGVDILVDLKGFTRNVRLGIAAHRPAPVQVNYLGYPGTMGASFIDYIIADPFVIPEDQQRFFSEKVVYLPDCYQPNDRERKIADEMPTREACGLPAQGFVFCCFNATYKITPPVFDIWMRLLQKIPGSVLWLFEANPSVKGNLKQEAERRGVDPARIIFAPKTPIAEHLARQRLADLFLDTLPVNAHTTASDALWAGLPVLTCAGTTFAGRVAGSLLKAADLPELITYSLEDYEALALTLAQNPVRLSGIRKKLERTRLQAPLFDIEKLVRNIEKSYQAMWDIRQAGDSPKSFTVT